jgi:hypothetical protein
MAELNEPQKGIITVNRLSRSSEINLPSNDEELKAA